MSANPSPLRLAVEGVFAAAAGVSASLFIYSDYWRECCRWAAAGPVDTDLSFSSFLELYRADVSERRVTARRVVEPLDVVEHV
jgi:hypothetical protein